MNYAAPASSPSSLRVPPESVARLKADYTSRHSALMHQFLQSGKPAALLRSHTELMDEVVATAVALAGAQCNTEGKGGLACVATGSFGRCELFPYSDVDVLFLCAEAPETMRDLVQEVLRILWDLGLQVGHAVRSLEETVQEANRDHTISASLLDARYICGDKALFSQLEKRLDAEVFGQHPQVFVEAKLDERTKRHQKQGDSRYILEPNVKESKGGLRDLHTLYWLARYAYRAKSVAELVTCEVLSAAEYRQFKTAEQFLWVVRAYVHCFSGRPEERLTFDMQKRVAESLGYRGETTNARVERFMKRYFQVARQVGDLTRLFCANLEEAHKRRPRMGLYSLLSRRQKIGAFGLEGERLVFESVEQLREQPLLMLELFQTSHESGVDIHPRALQMVSQHLRLINAKFREDPVANRIFIELLTSAKGPDALRRLAEAGILARFIPDFAHVIGQMQYDMYHVYTVDEHTLVALGILHRIEKGELRGELPLASEIIKRVESRRVLHIALFCHDIAKGRGGNHEQKGEEVMRKLAKRFGLNDQETETAAWLVREQSLFSDTANKRDLDDPQTIEDFAAKVQSPERLRLLLLLTVSDIRAVGPQIWNGWKGALLRDLYRRAEELMTTGALANTSRVESILEQVGDRLQGWSAEEKQHLFDVGYPTYWLARSVSAHVEVAGMLRRLWQQSEVFVLESRLDTFNSVTHVSLTTLHRAGLMNLVAGVMTVSGANIVGAKQFVLRDNTAVMLLTVQDIKGNPIEDERRIKKMRDLLVDALAGKLDLHQQVQAQQRPVSAREAVFEVTPQVFIDNEISATHTVIEVNGRDRIGFLYDVTRALGALGLNIGATHVNTYGEKVVDVFYVKDTFGFKVIHWDRVKEMRGTLLATLGGVA